MAQAFQCDICEMYFMTTQGSLGATLSHAAGVERMIDICPTCCRSLKLPQHGSLDLVGSLIALFQEKCRSQKTMY